MHFDLSIFHYFSKGVRAEVEELSASTGIANFAIAMVTIFEPIFLYHVLGLTVQQVLLFMAAVYACYLVLIPWGAKLTSVFGYRRTLVLSIPFQILFWLLIIAGKISIVCIFIAPVIFAMQKSLYWPGFHAIVARFASREQKGREFGAMYAIVNISAMLGPMVGGFLMQRFGFTWAFFTASFIYALSAIPLLMTAEVFSQKLYQYKDTLDLFRAYPTKALGYLGFGEELLALTIWPIYIYIVVQGYESTGNLATVASFGAAILALAVGKITDVYTKRILVKLGAFFAFITWAIRFLATSVAGVFATDTMGRTSKSVVFIPLSALTYLRAESTHIMPYTVFFEQSLSIGKLLASLLGIAIFTVTGGGAAGFIGLFVLAALFSLLYMFI